MGENRKLRKSVLALALALAVLTGWVQVLFGDLNLGLLAAMAFALATALISPKRFWIWGLLIGFAAPAAELYLILRGHPVQRGAVLLSFGALLPAFVGAAGGFAMRSMVAGLFGKADEPATTAAGGIKDNPRS
ncbi:MAG TPA: hypothetical protein VD837_08250 [Terriglobales bacterium]|nr:hypothetical protein [Terriglobales bacterium]